MTLLTFLHIINIITVMLLAFYIRHVQGNKPYSLFWSVIFFLCFSYNGIKWFISHPVYLVRQLIFGILICIDVTLIGQLIENNSFYHPIFILVISPIALGVTILCNRYIGSR